MPTASKHSNKSDTPQPAAKKGSGSRKAAKKPNRRTVAKKPAGRPTRKQASKKPGSDTPPSKQAQAGKTAAKASKKKKPAAKASRQQDAAAEQAPANIQLMRANVPPPPPSSTKRNFGLRGAAPWVARHAAKHAAELRARNAQPPPPGSARATLRVPLEAEEIKAKITKLHKLCAEVRALRKRFDRSFFEIGELLAKVQQQELHQSKGYSSFEAFLDREIDLGRVMALRTVRIFHTFKRETAYDYGLERLTLALSALDGELTTVGPSSQPSSHGFSSTALPVKPPIRFED